ncbi:MAG: hypothetical protein ACRDRK_04380 [Pseudonocardia sp.]
MTSAVHYTFAPPDDLPPLVGTALRILGVWSADSGVRVDDDVLDITYGPWRLTTPIHNLASADVDGPYSPWRAIGPRLSLADRGLTFGSNTKVGACIRFHHPVPGIEPTGLLLHPSVTVTVERPDLLVRCLRRAIDLRRP